MGIGVLIFFTIILTISKIYSLNDKQCYQPLSPVGDPYAAYITNIEITKPENVYGKASWYGESDEECLGCSESRRMANGKIFDETKMTTACDERWSLGQKLKVKSGNRAIVVECTDRGGFSTNYNRVLDLSKGAFSKLGSTNSGIINVVVEKI